MALDVGLVPFVEAIDLFDFWIDNPPPSESIRALLSAFTDWKPSNRRGRGELAFENEEKRDLGGLALEVGIRTMSASTLPDYMKQTMNKEFGLSLN